MLVYRWSVSLIAFSATPHAAYSAMHACAPIVTLDTTEVSRVAFAEAEEDGSQQVAYENGVNRPPFRSKVAFTCAKAVTLAEGLDALMSGEQYSLFTTA
jgi:hypothetical protein